MALRFNEFSGQTNVAGLPGFKGELTDAGAIRLRFSIHERFGFLPPQELFEQILTDEAHKHRFHPVRDYLGPLSWDGAPRIDRWLVDYGGAKDTPFNQAVGRIFLVAGVRRVRQPGVKFDTVIVVESPVQGMDKSSAARVLAVCDEWFSDCLPLGASAKEATEGTHGIWLAEFGELNGLTRRDREQILAFLSRKDDRARLAYGRRSERVPRQFIGIASTNETERAHASRGVRSVAEDRLADRVGKDLGKI